MDNPFKDEASAFRLVFLTLAAFAVIVLAGVLINGWAALVAWLVLTGVAIGYYLVQRGSGPPPRQHVPHTGPAAARRILVVVDETIAGDVLAAHVRPHLRGSSDDRVLVVAPALTSHGHRWTDDTDADRTAAERRVQETVDALGRAGITAEGSVGSPEPLEATEDAIHVFGADQIVVVTHARTSENWAEKGFVDALRERFDVPVDHVLAAEPDAT